MSLHGKVCLVTGASRGIGKGIALQLGEAGATVYITGRTLQRKQGAHGSLEETAEEVELRGGQCIPVQCDHSKDEDIEALFARIRQEQQGKLDLLVNNAYSAVNLVLEVSDKKSFWELPPSVWDEVNNVGLRNHYICTVYATRMMVHQGRGLILWVSSMGGMKYVFNTAYGVGKAAVDRMAADCGYELRNKGVCCVSLWPSGVQTELVSDITERARANQHHLYIRQLAETPGVMESTEYTGKAVVRLMTESEDQLKKRNGKIVIVGDVADQYGFHDINGTRPKNPRSVAGSLFLLGYPRLAWFFPRFLKLPKWMFTLMGHKF